MRHLIIGLCVFAAACAGEAPTAPSTSSPIAVSSAGPTVVRPLGGAVMTARGGSELPFKGTLEATQTSLIQGTTILVNAVGTGNATHLGQFTLTFQGTVVSGGASSGTGTWTAANGDQLFTTITGQGVGAAPGMVDLVETHTITGGTGRFVGASGAIILHRSLNRATGISSASITGTINLGH